MVIVRALKVDDLGSLLFGFPVGALDSNRDTLPDKGVLLLVDLHEGGGGQAEFHLFLSLVQLGKGEPRVQALESLPKIPGEQDLLIACPAEGAVLTQLLRVVGIGHLPAQLPLQQMPGRFLNKDIFGVVVAHGVTPYYSLLPIFQLSSL